MIVRLHHMGPGGPFACTEREVVTHALAESPIASDGLLKAEIVRLHPLGALVRIGVVPTKNVMELARLYVEATGRAW